MSLFWGYVVTPAQKSALEWIEDRDGDGCFDKHGAAFAQGETAPVTRTTWNALEKLGLIEFYGGKQHGGSGYGRLRRTSLSRRGL